MNDLNQFAIVGTGAVGGYYGGLLQQAGFDVHFLLHNDYDSVQKKGLTIESPNGNFQLPNIQAYNTPTDMPRADVIVIALKTTSNSALKNILPQLVKENSIVLTLQNGMGSEEEIADIIGAERVLGGLCFLCANKISPGHIRHLDYGLITLGEYRNNGLPGGITPQLKKLGAMLASAGISTELVDDLALSRWKKLVWNIPFNGLSVIRNALTSQLVKDPETRALCETLMKEVASASAVCARPIDPVFIEKMISNTEKMKPYAPSMKLDFDRGNSMEVESIWGCLFHC